MNGLVELASITHNFTSVENTNSNQQCELITFNWKSLKHLQNLQFTPGTSHGCSPTSSEFLVISLLLWSNNIRSPRINMEGETSVWHGLFSDANCSFQGGDSQPNTSLDPSCSKSHLLSSIHFLLNKHSHTIHVCYIYLHFACFLMVNKW